MKRLCTLLLLVGACSWTFSGCRLTAPEKQPLRVLSIGNSFSASLLRYFPRVAQEKGLPLDFTMLAIGGCSLQRHWENVEKADDESFRPYDMARFVEGRRVSSGKINLVEALRLEEWDVVTIQQASPSSWQAETYRPYGDKLVAKIRELAPKAKICVQETWSYTPFDARLSKWGVTPDEMYAKLHQAYADFAARHALQVIPTGAAIQAWRKRLPVAYTDHSYGGDVVGGRNQEERDHFKRDPKTNRWVKNSDAYHLNERGEYFQALLWTSSLFGVSFKSPVCRPACVTPAEADLMCRIVRELVPSAK